MTNKLSILILALVVLLAGATRGASGAVSTTVPVGQWVTLPISGTVRAEAGPADVAIASADGDAVRVYGLRPGSATLIVTTSDGIEARPIRVVAAAAADLPVKPQVGQCPPSYFKAAGSSHFALDAPDLALDWTPSAWRLEWTPADARILISNALSTPLEELGVPASLGVQVDWQDRWQLIAGDGVGLVGYRVPGAGRLALGESALGPAGFVDVSLGDTSISAVALKSQGGQLLSAAQAAVNVGPVNVGYATGQAGGSPIIQYRSGTVSASASSTAGQGLQLGVGIGVTPGWTIASSWTAAGEWRLSLAVSIDGGAVATSDAKMGSKVQDSACLP